MTAVRERQRKAFNRILDILEEKRDINESIMSVEDRKKLITEREELTKNYYHHINNWARHYKRWIQKGSV